MGVLIKARFKVIPDLPWSFSVKNRIFTQKIAHFAYLKASTVRPKPHNLKYTYLHFGCNALESDKDCTPSFLVFHSPTPLVVYTYRNSGG